MKTQLLILCSFMLFCANMSAQNKDKVSRYEVFIYCNAEQDVSIDNDRGRGNLLGAVLSGVQTISGGYVNSVLDYSVNTIASLLTKNANNKLKWEEIVKAENVYQDTLTTVEPINDFYEEPSKAGPMDPADMKFNGIGCLRTIDGDTVFYISCHINKSRINRINNHSKFELSLDTLVIAPFQCNLPNSSYDTTGLSFERQQNLQFFIEMRLISSWMTAQPMLQKDQTLGCFTISIPINQTDSLDSQKKLRYVRKEGVPEKYRVDGESFVVPRSYMGYRDKDNDYNYEDIWGTGEYKIELLLKESCDISKNFRDNWKSDWKRRQKAAKNKNFIQSLLKEVTTQKWDTIGKQWIITTLKGPADMIKTELGYQPQ